jgi:hypothetical protein
MRFMDVQTKPLSEITNRAIELLSKEIGIVDTVRFLNQFTTGYGDYTDEARAKASGRIEIAQVDIPGAGLP